MKFGIVKTFFACMAVALAVGGAQADVPVDCTVQSDLKIGRVYTGMMWKSSSYTDNELWDKNDIGLYDSEYAFIPVVGSGVIKPIVIYCNTPEKCLDSVKVWTDQQMFSSFTPSGVNPSRWEDDDDEWEYESDNGQWEFPKDVWPDKKPIEGRRWIVVRGKKMPDEWSGLYMFRVGILGTSEVSADVYVRPNEYTLNPPIADHIRGINVKGVERFSPWTEHRFDSNNGVYVSEYNFCNEEQVNSGKNFAFTVALPSAGTLVITGDDIYDDGSPTSKTSIPATGKNIVSDVAQNRSNTWEDDDFRFSEESFWKTSYAKAVRRINVSAATTLTFKHKNRHQVETTFNRMYFFPADEKSVAIEVGYFDQDENAGVNLIHGYVTGSGVYKSGETAMFKAVAGEGEEFDRWEVRFGNLTLTDEQKTNPVLSFTVTDAMCGKMEDEEQIFISAIWKPKYKVVVLPSIVGAGTVAGTGRYFEGEAVTLSATPADGCTFVKWSDGETSATRQIEVAAEEEERVIYACFEAPEGVLVDDGNSYGPFIAGDKVEIDVGLLGYAAKGLPAGLKYDAKKGVVSGAAKTPGEYEATFTKKGESDETVIITVRAEEVSAGCEGLSSGSFIAGVAGAAGGIPLEIETETGVKSVAMAKLPAGMKFDAKTWLITGAPTKAGDSAVTVTVTTKSGAKRTETITVSVAALPDGAVGAFNGFVRAPGGDENVGTVQVTTTDAGKITAKVTTVAGSYSFSGTCWDAVEDGVYSAALATKKGETLTLELKSNAGWDKNQLTGAFSVGGESRDVAARKNAFGKTWYFNAAGNETEGWTLSYAPNAKVAALTVTLNADGSTKIAGKLGAISVNGSGYADVTGLADGVIHADFVPIVSMKAGKATVKRALSLRANLWFDRLNEHAEDAGTALVLNETL